jgi:hypothetical protein
MKPVATPRRSSRPWGLTIALLTASFVTLVGVACRLEPDVILLRAAGAAAVLGVATRILTGVGQMLTEKNR